MAEYNVGDRILVRDDLQIDDIEHGIYYMFSDTHREDGNYGYYFVSGMAKYMGEYVTINKVLGSEDGYFIDQDGGEFVWTDEMFEFNRMVNPSKEALVDFL